ncbi:MAG: RDD family protein [Acidobacteria bacterium]|nr:RDD family protein [Acidobacteriota bacterium]
MPPRPWIRFWARMIDSIPMTLLVEYIAPALGLPSDTWSNYASAWACMVLWIPVEALMLASWGTTPGKFVLDVRVKGDLAFGRTLNRSAQVFIKGMAAAIPIVALFSMVRSYKRLMNRGVTAWDEATGLQVAHGPVTPLRMLAAALLIVLSLGLEMATMNGY